jgi:O-methyltransferase involved in polyketide biosynthesis
MVSSEPKVDGATLTGVSETALLTLKVRASEARRPDAIIDDPMAIELVDAIDFDWAKFGYSRRQDMALRALAFDDATRTYLLDHPAATVVALAEGLQTSFYRLTAGGAGNPGVGDRFRWLTVDLPPIVELRTKLLPPSDRLTVCAQSALDYSWMDRVAGAGPPATSDGATDGVFITAEGLLMYLQPAESLGLIAECARRFPGGRMMFDLPPSWFAMWARRGLRTSLRYRVPPMPFAMSAAEAANLVDVVPGIRVVHDVPLPRGRGTLLNTTMWAMQRIPLFDPVRPALTLLEFG